MENKSKETKSTSLSAFLLARWKENYYEALVQDDPYIAVYCLGVGDGYADAYLTVSGEDASKVFPDYEKITDTIINRI